MIFFRRFALCPTWAAYNSKCFDFTFISFHLVCWLCPVVLGCWVYRVAPPTRLNSLSLQTTSSQTHCVPLYLHVTVHMCCPVLGCLAADWKHHIWETTCSFRKSLFSGSWTCSTTCAEQHALWFLSLQKYSLSFSSWHSVVKFQSWDLFSNFKKGM